MYDLTVSHDCQSVTVIDVRDTAFAPLAIDDR